LGLAQELGLGMSRTSQLIYNPQPPSQKLKTTPREELMQNCAMQIEDACCRSSNLVL
jgi:hypothetical protein